MKWATLIVLTFLVSGCAGINKIESGSHKVGEKLTLKIEGAWNHLDLPGIKPAQVWTMEGITIDELKVFTSILDGQLIHPESPSSSKNKDFRFRSNMQIEEVVSMFEGTLTRDGSLFKLLKIEPYNFGGKPGFRFEYELTRKLDNVQLHGIGHGAIHKGELFAMLYHAPRLTFFPRHRMRIETMAQAALIKDQ